MPLLGWPLLVTLALVTVLATAAVVVLWSRVHGPASLRLAQRVALVLCSQVAAVLLVAAALNNYGFFYGSWSDLLGTTVAAPRDGAPPRSGILAAGVGTRADRKQFARLVSADPPIAGVTSWSAPSQWPTRGRVQAMQVTGGHSRLSEEALVYLPPQYFQKAYSHSQFPAVEVLTGYPGATRGLVLRMHYPDVLLAQIKAHRSVPMVLVMMRPTVVPPRDTECTDVPAGPQALTYFAEDVPRAIAQSLRVRPTGWGAMGDSTGGYCATKMAMTHSSTIVAAVSLSGYYHTLKDGTTGDLWGGSAQVRSLNDLEWVLRHQPAPPVAVLATIGSKELSRTGVRDTMLFASLVKPPMQLTTVVVPGGGHNFDTWAQVMPRAFTFLSSHLAPSGG